MIVELLEPTESYRYALRFVWFLQLKTDKAKDCFFRVELRSHIIVSPLHDVVDLNINLCTFDRLQCTWCRESFTHSIPTFYLLINF